MDPTRDLLLPILTGILAIVAERWIYNHSPALRRAVGAEQRSA